jgi:hypothetical protein
VLDGFEYEGELIEPEEAVHHEHSGWEKAAEEAVLDKLTQTEDDEDDSAAHAESDT